MSFPDQLRIAIDNLLLKIPKNVLSNAASDLSQRYRSADRDGISNFMQTDAHRLAYLAVRMPATYAVVRKVLEECKQRMPDFLPVTMADIGAGPGTAAWAALDAFPNLTKAALYENDKALMQMGATLMQEGSSTLRQAEWHAMDLQQAANFPSYDLTILSYVTGELPLAVASQLVEKVWKASDKVMVIIEPGTPHGFKRILAFRTQLLESGAFLVAPCPHHRTCPMQGGDWCHFAVRLERSSTHMAVKDVSMGFEDEKYSYIVASKTPVALPEARILRHPQRHSGHIDFILCAQSGLEKKVISKRMGEIYKKARKLDWGDSYGAV